MTVSFLIPLYDCLALTQAMLASLRATLPPGLAHEIIFIDDGSTDGTRAWLATLAPDPSIRVILQPQNFGYAAANNAGAAVARGEFLALLNNDLILTPLWLEPILAAHHTHGDRAGLVGNLQIEAVTGALDHAGIFINLKGKPEHLRTPPLAFRLSPFAPRYRRVAAVTGACVVIRRNLWEKLGGFDEAFINGCEDVDLCLRASDAGHINLVALKSVVRHHVSSSSGRKLRDEANTRELVRRWHDTLARHAARIWCRDYLETYLRDPRDFPDAALARQAFFYALHLRPAPPPGALAGMAKNLAAELTRWRKIL
ncbi:MAG: glycosyltransferase [Undibacterium sp.]|nr:glycosyltransferase [Opitutaceae bacterium]